MGHYVVFLIILYLGMKINSFFTSSICFFRGFSGIPCPSCGITRAYKLLLKGDFIGAFYIHPLFFIPIIILILFLIKKMDIVYKYKYFLLILFLSVYIYRLITLFPNEAPMIFNQKGILPRIINIFFN
ncbi:DUF2752 domain-containing protein [Oceanirhabdus sp. W0125-5]|uniref:DUF2752 domain-containing protein n=1 Tax=Oceanirhabdus sp. W0125-5 TaxID=2999116 RepID=UPI003FA563CD